MAHTCGALTRCRFVAGLSSTLRADMRAWAQLIWRLDMRKP